MADPHTPAPNQVGGRLPDQVRGRLSIAGLGTGGLITAAAIGVLSQRCPDYLDFSRNVLDIAPLGIIVIAIGGAIGEGIRRLFSKPASVEPEASTPQQQEQYHA